MTHGSGPNPVLGSRQDGGSTSIGRPRREVLAGVWLGLLGFIFVAVNFQKVTIDFIVAETKAPLVIALLICGLARIHHRAGSAPIPQPRLRPPPRARDSP